MAAMTRKERFERALRQDEVDRVPFWVKIFAQDYLHCQDDSIRALSDLELADCLDLDHLAGGGSPVVRTNDRVEIGVERQNGRRVTTWQTVDRMLTGVEVFDEGSHSWHPREFPVKTREDIRAARDVFAYNQFEARDDLVKNNEARLRAVGDRGIVITGMGISPVMNLIQHLIGPETTYYFLADYPDDMEELIGIMHEERLRFLRCSLASCPFDYVCSVENTSTTLLSPAVFEKYCWQHLNDYGRLITEAGKYHMLHMCGKLKDLLPKIDELPAQSIEAFTAPPVGNTTIADRVHLCSTKAIIGGTDATLWLKPVDEICAAIEASIREAGTLRGLVLTSAGVMTPLCPIEKIRQVREFAKGLTPERYN